MGRFFEPTSDRQRNLYAEEALIADVQYEISKMLDAKSVSRAELARRIGVSAACVSQMLGNKPKNLTVRTIARIFTALGEEPCLRPLSQVQRERASATVTLEECTWTAVAHSKREFWFEIIDTSAEIRPPVPPPVKKGAEWLKRYEKEAA